MPLETPVEHSNRFEDQLNMLRSTSKAPESPSIKTGVIGDDGYEWPDSLKVQEATSISTRRELQKWEDDSKIRKGIYA